MSGEENCEKSENESDEFHPSMKRLTEKLEFQGATVSKTIRSKDEDTAVDSEAGLKDQQEERYKTPNESAAASETLEPVAWDYRYSGWMEGKRVVEKEEPVNCPDKEPLVRLSDVVSLLEKVEREAEAYTTAEEDPVTAFKHGSEFVMSSIRERLEEFTQGESGE